MNEKLRRKLYSACTTFSKLRKKINTKLPLTKIVLTLKNFPSIPVVPDKNFNILYIYCILVHIL